ncbi:MAG: aminomethyl-transferring glycine dehydrogenase subunit GcvPA [Deltaproteobacteria bacterium]|nr:aminomethyl-transferring glycine dehydrogenase subunit GcvPA [Deltaproteobacteria bacterium]
MRYLPHTEEDISVMLSSLGMESLDDLFTVIPHDCLRTVDLKLPEPLTEWELTDSIHALSREAASSYKIFIGAGSYDHFIPQSVSYLLGRSEFVTSYTPYQPEISQGTLQAIYEYQTLTARLLGMEVANASLYDGASALAEALLMSIRITKRNRVAISRLIHPLYRSVVETYLKPTGYEITELPYLPDGTTDLSFAGDTDDLAAIALQSPNFFGSIENLRSAAEKAHKMGALFIASFTEPMAYGLLKNPGILGADIACGEGQSLGIPRSFGGPTLGMFATKTKYVRNIPGRLVGKTEDSDCRKGFVLTLATREQHIRREKATSNICTNNSLCALAASMYMASIGGTGMRKLAQINYDKSEYLKRELMKNGYTAAFNCPTFNEFVVHFTPDFKKRYDTLMEEKIVAGLPLKRWYPELPDHYLLCCTETMTREDMDLLVREVSR